MLLFKGWTPLMIAALGGDLNIVEFLIKKGGDVNVKSNDGKFLILNF